MKKYVPSNIEPKWQKKWAQEDLNKTDLSNTKNKYYVLVELPYTSGDLHMGHWFTFTMGDILARFKRRQGCNVLFPNGFDAFGLPAENAAIKQKVHPRDWTYQNIARMKEQFGTMGVSIDWQKTAITCDPEYYKWNQWIFLKMLERGIAYRGKALSNWCPSCQTVLADENVEAGKCWRCGSEVVKKEVMQWFLKLTHYADKLLWQNPPQVDWPKPLIEAQNDWIGKSEGINITYEVAGTNEEIVCFTTRPDTNFGATFIVLAPEHPLVLKLSDEEYKNKVKEYIDQSAKKSELQRKENKEKTGVFTGKFAINQLNDEKMPIWVADYVLMGYGTGAVVGVPGHDRRDFEFAKKFDLAVKRVVVGKDGDTSAITQIEQVQEKEGKMVNSSFLDGLDIHQATKKIMDYLEKKGWGKKITIYHLHDWSISRQRYWGTPIPVIHCDNCGVVPVAEKDLPVELPYQVDYQPQGKPPLATSEDWVLVKCPKCGGKASREVETMDGFVDNSWYFYRYLDSKNEKSIFDKDLIANWIPVNIYIGGAEHTVGHTLYSRFFTKFFHDLGLISFDEYALKRVHHGVILGPDGARMSKSRGNVVNPDEEVKKYGADAIRLYLMFLGPFNIVTAWNPDNVNGAYHFLQRVWGLQEKVTGNSLQLTDKDLKLMHKTIKKVTEDIGQLKFNTAIATLMEWLNYLSKKDKVLLEEYKILLQLLAPFAPYITEELWSISGEKYSIHQQPWPQSDNKYLQEVEVSLPVQVNGKVKDVLLIQKDILDNKEVIEKMALTAEKVQKFLSGKSVKKVIYIPGKVISLVVSN
ncbi:leucine--tRNA ligase [Candidatus Daviesbacteria bacterium]|nr:leucine--tRNA ligase [Candidatus Daviesbacteria bacterium]